MPKLLSYNVNGIRAAMRKGLMPWLKTVDTDILLLQEIKATEDQIDREAFRRLGFEYQHWHPAKRKGYSGTAILSKKPPKTIEKKTGFSIADDEGRVLFATFDDFSVISLYLPSGTNDERLRIKFRFMDEFALFTENLLRNFPSLIVSGDFNICHKPIDIHDPVRLKNVSGFLPEERQWLSEYINLGFDDSFRLFNPRPHQYTWWSYRAASKERNKGWRIDYHLTSKPLRERTRRHVILREVSFSDHAPILLEVL